ATCLLDQMMLSTMTPRRRRIAISNSILPMLSLRWRSIGVKTSTSSCLYSLKLRGLYTDKAWIDAFCFHLHARLLVPHAFCHTWCATSTLSTMVRRMPMYNATGLLSLLLSETAPPGGIWRSLKMIPPVNLEVYD